MRDIQEYIKSINPALETIIISPQEIVFEERVLLACFNCPRYGVNHTCPPKIPRIDYKKLILEYDNALLVWIVTDYDEGMEASARRESTLLLHHSLLQAEKYFWGHSNSLATSFIGGSCKLCAQGCSTDTCRQPALSRIPMEAAGINVVKTCQKKNIDIFFPPRGSFYRIGLLLW